MARLTQPDCGNLVKGLATSSCQGFQQPSLQYLRVTQHYPRRGKDFNVQAAHIPQALDPLSLVPPVPPHHMPSNLRLIVVDIPRYDRLYRSGPVRRMDSESKDLAMVGFANAEVLATVLPSLEAFDYYCYRRRVGGSQTWEDRSEDARQRPDDEWGAKMDWL